jgi:hypothetical protein
MKKAFLFLLGLLWCFGAYSQTFACKIQTDWECEGKLKASHSIINISSKEITISNFLNGGTEPLLMTVDSIVSKDYHFHESTWYYCKSDSKAILIKPTSESNKRIDLYIFSDEVTLFHYGFSYK